MTETPCPICRTLEGRPLFFRRNIRYSECHQCRLIFQDPPLSQEVSKKFYEKDYYNTLKELTPSIQRARTHLYRQILSEWISYRQTNRLLDIGSGYGDFLKIAMQGGWNVWGIEPSREASLIAQKTFRDQVLNSAIEAVDFPENYFDIITLWNVLDYFHDPVAAIRKAYQWLRPGGCIVIRTPNAQFHLRIFKFYLHFQSLLQKLGINKEPSVLLRSNFRAGTIKYFLETVGFVNVRVENGRLTQGDPYQIFSFARIMDVSKLLLYYFARGIAFLSFNRIFIGSVLLARATKK